LRLNFSASSVKYYAFNRILELSTDGYSISFL